ncbi:MAG TPA: hypothetical protein VFF06_00040 [Polyangia bacterium]|nr:hypothetical protein [Polyangia bacterium]
MGLTLTIGLYTRREHEIEAALDLYRRLGGRVEEALEHRNGERIAFITEPPNKTRMETLSQCEEQVPALDERWFAECLRRVAPASSSLRFVFDVSVAPLDLKLDLVFFGAAHRGGETRKSAGTMELDVDDYSLSRQHLARRPGSKEFLPAALELLRLASDFGAGRKPFVHTVLHPEAGWSVINAWAFYHASIAQLPSVFLWLYLEACCDLSIPAAIDLIERKKRLPSSKRLAKGARYLAKQLPRGQELETFLKNYDLEKAKKLAATSPERIWDVLCDIVKDDPSWRLERAGDEVMIGNDAGARLWEPYVAAAQVLLGGD